MDKYLLSETLLKENDRAKEIYLTVKSSAFITIIILPATVIGLIAASASDFYLFIGLVGLFQLMSSL